VIRYIFQEATNFDVRLFKRRYFKNIRTEISFIFLLSSAIKIISWNIRFLLISLRSVKLFTNGSQVQTGSYIEIVIKSGHVRHDLSLTRAICLMTQFRIEYFFLNRDTFFNTIMIIVRTKEATPYRIIIYYH